MRTKRGRGLTNGPRRNRPSGEQEGRDRGQAIAEFAFVLPILLLIMAGIIDFGFAMYSRISVINAAGDGARAGSLNLADVRNKAAQAVTDAMSGAGLSGAATSVTCVNAVTGVQLAGGGNGCTDADKLTSSVVVSVSYAYHSIFASLFGTTIPLGSTVQMVIQK